LTTRALCRLADLPPDATKGFRPPRGGFTGLFALRSGDAIRVYVNACPHLGTPLDWAPDRFLSTDGTRIVCSMHGAEFEPLTGLCTRGPCQGRNLELIPHTIENGAIIVAGDAGL
jgi:nitrite reductase/ring-hydroxylating ferredoxin subunit